jgi:hypothetical protein
MTAHDLAAVLPDVPDLRRLCRSIAVAEAVLNPDDDYRYSTYGGSWSADEEVFAMRNGSGDELDVVFGPAGAYVHGFDHESPMSPYADDGVWPGVLDDVPDGFHHLVNHPAFADGGMPRVTFCLWREPDGAGWHTGRIDFPEGHADPDGSGWMCALLADPTPEAFCSFAEDYYQRPVDLPAVRHIYQQRPLTREVVTRLNPAASYAAVTRAAESTGYPA